MTLKSKLLLIMFGALLLVFIGIISSQSMFENQHVFSDTSTIDCSPCHDDIIAEIQSDTSMPHYDKNCTDCHQHPSIYADGDEHLAGAKVQCQACHTNSTIESALFPGTQGFNYTDNEAHWTLFDFANSSSLMGGANEACVACHTLYDLELTFSRPDYYQFEVDYGTLTFDGGILSGTPDKVVSAGLADVTNFDGADTIYYRDTNGNTDWDPDEDIFRDEGSGSYGSGDTILYVGSDGKDSDGTSYQMNSETEIFFLDSNHDGAYDYTSGNEEPLVYVGSDSGTITDDTNLLSTHEVLTPYTGITWSTDAIRFTGSYFFLDNSTGIPGTFDEGEPIILDDGDGIIESGTLDGTGSEDEVIRIGYPQLSDFVATDNVTFDDVNSNSNWDDEEDIIFDTDDDNTFDLYGSIFDNHLYVGDNLDLAHDDSLTALTSVLKYIDSDHSGNYTLGEPIVNSTNNYLDSNDVLLYRNDDRYNDGTTIYGLWDFDLNNFNSEFFIDNNNNGIYDNGEAIIRETFRIYNVSFSGIENSSFLLSKATSSAGLHVYRNGSTIWNSTGQSYCGDLATGCHQDIYNAVHDDNGGGHYTNSTLGGHNETLPCSTCHRDSQQIDPDNDHFDSTTGSWHSAKRITCAYEGGCHDSLFSNGLMQEIFQEINKVNLSNSGDTCWGCHRGDFDWSDPVGEIFKVYVEDEAAFQQVEVDGTTVYSPTNYNNCICHDRTASNVPTIPPGSGKYIDHASASINNFDQCTKCHQENADPHNDSHEIIMDWSTWQTDNGGIPSGFCNTTCHYSINDARPVYVDTNTSWMSIEYTNWLKNGLKHSLTTLLGGDNSTAGSVNCTSCHTTHGTVPNCWDSSCHRDNDALVDKRDVPDSHDVTTPGIIDPDRYPCARTACHIGGGHDPTPPSCHGGGGGCRPDTNAHPKHVIPSNIYDFDCTECHYDSSIGYNGGLGTFGGPNHNNGIKNINFDVTSNGTATHGGNLTGANLPTYDGSGRSCNNTYCHSNGYDISSAGPGSDWQSFQTPGWNSSQTVPCGGCHGYPNYYNGTTWIDLGGAATKNSPTHLKHTRNLGKIYSSRYLFWIDYNPTGSGTPPYGWVDAIYDSGEAIVQDNNQNRMLDYGVLNGGNNQAANPPQSPDTLFLNGTADLTDLVAADNVKYDDADSDSTWDRGEDIYIETGGGGNNANQYNPSKGDYIIYNGGTTNIADNGAGVDLAAATGDPIMYLDSDHDNVFDSWYNDGISEFSGVEEPLIYVSSNKATGANLDTSDEVLQGMSTTLLYWYVDMNRWYDFDCSECHYDSRTNVGGVSSGNGTYGTQAHVNMTKDIRFDITTNGIASKLGTVTTPPSASGAWDSTTKECYGIWCHSDGYERDDTDSSPAGNGYPDWSGTGAYDDASYDYHTTEPQWTDTTRTTVFCGSCHYANDKPSAVTGTDKPNTGAHRKNSQHTGASQFGWHSDNDIVICQECHWRYDTYGSASENQWWRAYGSYNHVDASVWIFQGAEAAGQFGPLSESQAYTGGCHNTWPGNWRSGYANSC
jgi:predicted CxxxxCH...CXXCH cytochrome family protein